MMPFLSSGSAQLTLSDVSKISVKVRRRTGPGAEKTNEPPHTSGNINYILTSSTVTSFQKILDFSKSSLHTSIHILSMQPIT